MVTNTRQPRAFTLIELLVVIAIIGVLSSVILASLNTARGRARDAKRESDLHSVQTALELYYSANNSYPLAISNWNTECSGWNHTTSNNVAPGLVPSYISQFPSDPAMISASNQNCYLYISNGTSYKFIDYNAVDATNPGAAPALVDPARNYGQSYANTTACSTQYNTYQDASKSLAVWSDSTSMCW